MNRDFIEMLNALADESVEYLVVGAYAVAGVPFQMLSKAHLIATKRATGRPQDLADVARLEDPEGGREKGAAHPA